MPVPNTMADLSPVAGSNSPAGSEAIGNSLDNYLRALSAIVRSTNAVGSASIAAASTINVAASDGESVQITGSATISSLGTGYVGCRRELRFAGACVLFHSASLILPDSFNISTEANAVYTFRCTGSNTWVLTGASHVSHGFLPDVLQQWNFIAPASKQDSLGFTPVRQGGGDGQFNNDIYIGWSGAKVLMQVDSNDLGAIALESWVNSALAGKANTSGQTFTGSVFATSFSANGSAAEYSLRDRSGAAGWSVYADNGLYRIWAGVDQIALDYNGNILRKDFNSGALRRQPRIFVGPTDPGAAAQDDDLWFN